jgi:hypothetical protein
MRATLPNALILVLLLGGCSGLRESRVNPFNWFAGTPSEGPAETIVEQDPSEIGTVLIDQITDIRMEPVQGGALLRVTGQMASQGGWDAQLKAPKKALGSPPENSLVVRFLVRQPPVPQPTSSAASRSVTAALFIDRDRLEELRTITVQGAQNTQSLRR